MVIQSNREPLIFGGILVVCIIFIVVVVCVSMKTKPTPIIVQKSPKRETNSENLTVKHSEPKLNFKQGPLSLTTITPDEKERLYTLTDKVLTELDNHNVIYWAGSGTLLGAVRHQGLIPWDDDIDIAVVYDQENMIKVRAALESLQKQGYPCGDTESGIKILDKDSLSFPWIDLMMVELGDDNRYTQCGELGKQLWSQVNYNKEHIFPLRKMKFGPLMIWCPNQSEKVLDDEFGITWRTHMSYKPSSLYGLRLIQQNRNVPTPQIREQMKQFEYLLPKQGTLVRLENVTI